MRSLPTLVRRGRAHLAQRRQTARFAAALRPAGHADLAQIGDLDSGYALPASLLGPDSICYLAGAGVDISFDLGVVARFGSTVHTFDPVPQAAEHVATVAAHEPRLVFHPVALWSCDQELTFHAPPREGDVSHSAVNLAHTEPAFTAAGRSLRSLMAEQGHDHIDLLKLSVAGAEYEVVRDVISNGIPVHILCVEYSPPTSAKRAAESVRALECAGYSLVATNLLTWTWKLTFVGPGVPKGEDPPKPDRRHAPQGRRRLDTSVNPRTHTR